MPMLSEGAWTTSDLTTFLVETCLILGLARLMVSVLGWLRQPAVVGELIAGILVGPTVLGRIPGFSEALFPQSSVKILTVVANLGLIFYLFTVGLGLDAGQFRADLKSTMLLSVCSMAVPLAAASVMSFWLVSDVRYASTNGTVGLLTLFLTCVMGITALPMMARILSERNLLENRLGKLALSVSAMVALMTWILLGIMLSVVSSPSEFSVLTTLLLIALELTAGSAVVRRVLTWLAMRDADGIAMSSDTFLGILITLFVTCWLAEIIGVSALIGAFQVTLTH